jgi:hypothetical protein
MPGQYTNCQMNGCPVKIIKVTSCLICNKIGTKKPFDGPCEITTLMRTGRLVRTTHWPCSKMVLLHADYYCCSKIGYKTILHTFIGLSGPPQWSNG